MTTIFNVHITFTKAREPPTLYTTVLLCSKISRISNIWQRIIISTAQSTLGEAQMVQDSSNKILRLKFSEKCLNICPPSTFFGKTISHFQFFEKCLNICPLSTMFAKTLSIVTQPPPRWACDSIFVMMIKTSASCLSIISTSSQMGLWCPSPLVQVKRCKSCKCWNQKYWKYFT